MKGFVKSRDDDKVSLKRQIYLTSSKNLGEMMGVTGLSHVVSVSFEKIVKPTMCW